MTVIPNGTPASKYDPSTIRTLMDVYNVESAATYPKNTGPIGSYKTLTLSTLGKFTHLIKSKKVSLGNGDIVKKPKLLVLKTKIP